MLWGSGRKAPGFLKKKIDECSVAIGFTKAVYRNVRDNVYMQGAGKFALPGNSKRSKAAPATLMLLETCSKESEDAKLVRGVHSTLNRQRQSCAVGVLI